MNPPDSMDVMGEVAIGMKNAKDLLESPFGKRAEKEIRQALATNLRPNASDTEVLAEIVKQAHRIAKRDGFPWPTMEEYIDAQIQQKCYAALVKTPTGWELRRVK